MYVLDAQSCLTLSKPADCSPPGSSVHGIFEARVLEQVAIPSPGDLPGPGIKPVFPALAGRFFITEPPGKPSLFTVLVSLLCYIHQCVIFFDSTVISYSICLWLTSLGIIPSKSIHVVADVKTSLFLWLSGILLYAYLCVYTYTHHIFIHSYWWTLRLLLCLAYCK